MSLTTRRHFLKVSALGLAGCNATPPKPVEKVKAPPHVVIIGGGFAGTIAAKYLRRFGEEIRITLIEARKSYISCPASNWVFAGLHDVTALTHDYQELAKQGVNIVHDVVNQVLPVQQEILTKSGSKITYDRLIIASGIDMRWDTIEGYTPEVSTDFPHAWKSGNQLLTLYKQIKDMKNGRTVVISAPEGDCTARHAIYERASLIAYYLRKHKRRSKVFILDGQEEFTDQALYEKAWKRFYRFGSSRRSILQRIPASKGGKITAFDAKRKVITTSTGEKLKATVFNIIPPQHAGFITRRAQLTDESGWCPVDPITYESLLHKNIHVIGDASKLDSLPKTGFMANVQAKLCASAVADLILERPIVSAPQWTHAYYSLISPNHGLSHIDVYKRDAQKNIIEVAQNTKVSHNPKLEAAYAQSWYTNVMNEMFR